MSSPFTLPKRGNLIPRAIQGAVFLWVGFIFYHYFRNQRIFDLFSVHGNYSNLALVDGTKLAANAMASLRIILTALLILFTLWRWGRLIFYGAGWNPVNVPLRFSMEMALGILFFNGLWLGLGLNHLWFQPLLLVLASAAWAWASWDFLKNFMKFQKLPRWAWPGRLPVLLVFLGSLCLALSAAQGLLPEIYYDGLVYHLATLSFWQFHHGIADYFTNLYSYYPFGAELYFFNGFFLQGGETAKMLNVAASALCALAAAGWALEEAGTASGCLAWSLVLFFPWVTSTVWTTQNDVVLAFFFILFYYSLFRWSGEKAGFRWALAAGIMGGAVLTMKYTAYSGVAAGFLALVFGRREIFARKKWLGWGLMLALMGFSLAPWFLKNFLYEGNGFYPYFSSWLGGKALPPGKWAELMNDHQAVLFRGFSPMDWLGRILDRDLDKTVAPILFAFLPFFFLPGPRRPATKYLAVLGALLLLFGFLTSHLLRLMLPAFLVCFLFIILTLADLRKKEWAGWGAGIILLFGLFSVLSLARLSLNYYRGDQMWLGKATSGEYLASLPPTASYIDLTKAAALLPETDQILIAGDSRTLYYPRAFYANSTFDDQVLAVLARKEKDGNGIGRALREMGIEDLAVAGSEGARLARQYSYYGLDKVEWAKLDDFIQRRTDLIYFKGYNGIYRLRDSPADRRAPLPNLLHLLETPQADREKVL